MNGSEPKAKTVKRFYYVKSNAFRTVYAEGAFGGISPKGSAIRMAFFNEMSAR